MRILVLNYEYPPVGGGGGRASADLAAALARRGHHVRVLTSRIPGLPPREARKGVEIFRARTGRRSPTRASFAAMMGYVVAATFHGTRMARRWRPDVLHAHFAVPTGAAAWAISWLTGRRYLLTIHLGDVPGGVPEKTGKWFRWMRRLTPPIWRRAAVVVAVSRFTRDLASREYHVPIRVIPNGVDLAGRSPQARPASSPAQIVFVGRFQPQKNPLQLIELLADVRHLDWRALLVGDGPLRAQVEERIRQRHLGDRVRLTGWLSSEQAEAAMAQADLLLIPSRSEGLPVVAVQALAHGLAIVGSRVGGLGELIDEGVNGFGCEPDDVEGFRAALQRCLSDAARLSSMKAASHAMAERYDLKRVAEEYETVLLEVSRS